MRFTLNGASADVTAHPMKRLLDVLRQECGLTGTKEGCGEGECGACTVLLDGEAVKSCTVLAAQADGAQVRTLEGLAEPDGTLHPVQAAFREEHGLQCGFCTSGMVMASVGLLASQPHPDEQQVREALEGNLCRCTGYHNIVRAVLSAAATSAPAVQQ